MPHRSFLSDLAFLRLPRKSLKFLRLLFSIPTAQSAFLSTHCEATNTHSTKAMPNRSKSWRMRETKFWMCCRCLEQILLTQGQCLPPFEDTSRSIHLAPFSSKQLTSPPGLRASFWRSEDSFV